MKKFNLILIFILGFTYSCKAQLQRMNNYSNSIIGIWILEEDSNQKIEFTSSGECKIYEENILHTTYQYTFEKDSCGEYFSNDNVIYLKWLNNNSETSCLEIAGMTLNTLSLMIIDSAQILYYIKQ